MKVLIFSGGSGSDALQTGLYEKYPELDITILLNGFDNGKSTGAIRQVFDGEILGPSDVRKNQTRQYALKNGFDDVYTFIEHRFTSDKPIEYIRSYYSELSENSLLTQLMRIVEDYFAEVPASKNIEYVDFSIGNIIYGHLAHLGNNSLQAAADHMRELLEIDQEVILNSDESLFLQATTLSGKTLRDEADIVDFANNEDTITGIHFLRPDGSKTHTSSLCQRAIDAIEDADLIIFSTGTQWSSLIPTYQCDPENGKSFTEIISEAQSKKYFIINGAPDKDMYGYDGDGILDVVGTYFDVKDTQIISGKTRMQPIRYDALVETLNTTGHPEAYNPEILACTIMSLYFGQPKPTDTFIFDWDDTIQGRRGTFAEESKENKRILPTDSIIVTGNTHHKVDLKNIPCFANGGVSVYHDGAFLRHLDDDVVLTKEVQDVVTQFLHDFGFNQSMLQNRGDVCLSIKPLISEYRSMAAHILNKELPEDWKAEITGKTTVDIKHLKNHKIVAVQHIMNSKPKGKVFYIGDELDGGNDQIIEKNKHLYNIRTVPVNNPKDTLTFLKTVMRST